MTMNESRWAVQTNGLVINNALSYEEWVDCGSQLIGMKDAIQWALGDWMMYGETMGWADRYAQAMDETRYSYNYISNCTWVARQFESDRRRVGRLSWSHHRVVAGLERVDQAYWLDFAERNQLSRDQLRMVIKDSAETPAPSNEDDEPPLVRAICEAVPVITIMVSNNGGHTAQVTFDMPIDTADAIEKADPHMVMTLLVNDHEGVRA